MKHLKHRAKQRRRQLNHSTITFGRNKLRGRRLVAVDTKGRVIPKLDVHTFGEIGYVDRNYPNKLSYTRGDY